MTARNNRSENGPVADNDTMRSYGSTNRGFTLAELLIALAILGVIATFAIPKILQNQQDSRRKAILKETIATIAQIHYEGFSTGIFGGNSSSGYLHDHINALKHCDSNASTGGCWDTGTQGAGTGGNPATGPGSVLHNGLTLLYGSIVSGPVDMGGGVKCRAYYVDWNGAEGPNTYGEDQIDIITSEGTATDSNPASWCYNTKPGTVRFGWDAWDASFWQN